LRDAQPEHLAVWFTKYTKGTDIRSAYLPRLLDDCEKNIQHKSDKKKRKREPISLSDAEDDKPDQKRSKKSWQAPSKKSKSASGPRCYNCNKQGYIVKDCPDAPTGSKKEHRKDKVKEPSRKGGKKSSKTSTKSKEEKKKDQDCMSFSFEAFLSFDKDKNGQNIIAIPVLLNSGILTDCRVILDSGSNKSVIDEDFVLANDLPKKSSEKCR